MSFEIYATANRARAWTGNLYQPDGVTGLVLNVADRLRVKIGRHLTPTLDIEDGTPSANGSTLTITSRGSANPNVPATYQLELVPGDLAWLQGPYDVELLVIDSGDSSRAKTAGTGVLQVFPAQSGAVT